MPHNSLRLKEQLNKRDLDLHENNFYPNKTYFPPKSKTEVGKETRFKKGERANHTLQKYTTNVKNGGFVV